MKREMVENSEIGEKNKGRKRASKWIWRMLSALMVVLAAVAFNYSSVSEISLYFNSTKSTTQCNQVWFPFLVQVSVFLTLMNFRLFIVSGFWFNSLL